MTGEYFLEKAGAGVQFLSKTAVLAQLRIPVIQAARAMAPDIPAAACREPEEEQRGSGPSPARPGTAGGSCEGQGNEEHEYSTDRSGFFAAGSQGVLVLTVKLPGVLHVFLTDS